MLCVYIYVYLYTYVCIYTHTCVCVCSRCFPWRDSSILFVWLSSFATLWLLCFFLRVIWRSRQLQPTNCQITRMSFTLPTKTHIQTSRFFPGCSNQILASQAHNSLLLHNSIVCQPSSCSNCFFLPYIVRLGPVLSAGVEPNTPPHSSHTLLHSLCPLSCVGPRKKTACWAAISLLAFDQCQGPFVLLSGR